MDTRLIILILVIVVGAHLVLSCVCAVVTQLAQSTGLAQSKRWVLDVDSSNAITALAQSSRRLC